MLEFRHLLVLSLQDSGYREAQAFAAAMQEQNEAITDIRSAAAASSRAAVAASAAISAIAMTKAAAARAAARAAQAAKDAGAAALSTVTQQQQQQQAAQQLQEIDYELARSKQDKTTKALLDAIAVARQEKADVAAAAAAAVADEEAAAATAAAAAAAAGGGGGDESLLPAVVAADGGVTDVEVSVMDTYPDDAEPEDSADVEEEEREVAKKLQRATSEIRER